MTLVLLVIPLLTVFIRMDLLTNDQLFIYFIYLYLHSMDG